MREFVLTLLKASLILCSQVGPEMTDLGWLWALI